MTARLFEIIQFFDNAGAPLAGGKIYTYEAGTSTPMAAFTDATAGTAHANPVVLNSAGRAQLWLFGQPYKLDVKTSTDTDIMVLDNVPATALAGTRVSTPATAQTTLACTSGALILIASGLVPANAKLLGAYVENLIAPGTSQGLSGYDVGSHNLDNRWASNMALTLGAKSTMGSFTLPETPVSASVEDITLTHRGGAFDGVGQVQITIEYETGTAP